MFELLYKYLILNREVSVPGIGTFVIERKPAKLDFANKVFNAPALQISFDSVAQTIDNKMSAFIAAQQKISETEAAENYTFFANKLKKDLTQYQNVDLPGIGMLSQNAEGKLQLQDTSFPHNFFPAVAAARILREHSSYNIVADDHNKTSTLAKEMPVQEGQPTFTAKDPWWIFAVALGIIGIAAIVYYYLNNSSLH